MLDAGTQLGEHGVGNIGRQLGAEEHTHPLGSDEFHRLLNLIQKGLRGVLKQKMRLVEKEHQLGLVQIANLGQIGEQISQHPHQERGEHHRPSRLLPDFEESDDPASLRVDAKKIGRVHFGFTEECVAALSLEVDQRPQDHTGGRRRHPTDRFQLLLALITGEVRDHRTQILQIQQRQALLIRPMEDQTEGGFLGRVKTQHLRQQDRPEG